MDEMRRARHDLRQHLAVVQSFIDRDDKAGLSEYIDIYKSELPPDTLELYCRDDVVNAVLCYYASQARGSGIRFEAKVDYPADCPVSATDITVLLGNLLENAVEACRREPMERRLIRLRVARRGGAALLVLADNPCLAPVSFEDGCPCPPSGRATASARPPCAKSPSATAARRALSSATACSALPSSSASRGKRKRPCKPSDKKTALQSPAGSLAPVFPFRRPFAWTS